MSWWHFTSQKVKGQLHCDVMMSSSFIKFPQSCRSIERSVTSCAFWWLHFCISIKVKSWMQVLMLSCCKNATRGSCNSRFLNLLWSFSTLSQSQISPVIFQTALFFCKTYCTCVWHLRSDSSAAECSSDSTCLIIQWVLTAESVEL